MTKPTIADASRHIEELLAALDDAYWEAATIERKDLVYSILVLLHAERMEIAKLSIQDHTLPYEPISLGFIEVRNRLASLRKHMDNVVLRPSTAQRLDQLINRLSVLFD